MHGDRQDALRGVHWGVLALAEDIARAVCFLAQLASVRQVAMR
jgi:hypothetical protein